LIRKVYISIFLICQLALGAQVQRDDLMQLTMDHFGSPAKGEVWWLKDMRGYFDHSHEVRMILATDNKVFKGAYEILSSKQRFFLDGNHDGQQIVLVESDSLGRNTGIIYGDMNEDKFYCTWSDPKKQEQYPLFLFTQSPYKNPCGNIGYAMHYQCRTYGNDSMRQITIVKYEDDVYMDVHYAKSKIRHKLSCQNDACSQFRHIPTSLEDQQEYRLDLATNAITIREGKLSKKIDLVFKRKLTFDCNTFMDFDTKNALIYPISNDKKFNTWVAQTFTSKYFIKDNSGIKRSADVDLSIADRMSVLNAGDVILDYMTDSIMSGVFFIQHSSTAKAIEVPFIWNFMKSKNINMQDMFDKGYLYDGTINKYIANIKSKDDDIREKYFSKCDYNIRTYTNEGILCRTPFHSIYGRDEILVPFSVFGKSINFKWLKN
jgi:hypothetical protein